MQVVRVLAAVLGGGLVVLTGGSVLRVLVVPRGRIDRLQSAVEAGTAALFRLLTGRLRDYEDRDRLLAVQGPLQIGLLLGTWLLTFLIGFSALLWPQTERAGDAVREAGSSLLTLGFESTNHPWATIVDFLAATAGLAVVALQIGYLPTLYAAFNRRETEVTLLSSRAGNPPFGPELLARTRVGLQAESELDGLYRGWERWAADVAESHSNYPSLIRFRSPKPFTHWVVALLSVMDSAAMLHALAPGRAPLSGRLALRMGFSALRQIADAIGLDYDPDPLPSSDIELTEEEFVAAVTRLTDVGFVLERTAAEAWPHFRGWRVNYEQLAYALCWSLDAVPALWTGPRRTGDGPLSPIRPPVRSPEDPDGSANPGRTFGVVPAALSRDAPGARRRPRG